MKEAREGRERTVKKVLNKTACEKSSGVAFFLAGEAGGTVLVQHNLSFSPLLQGQPLLQDHPLNCQSSPEEKVLP